MEYESFMKHPVLARILVGILLLSTVLAIASTADMNSTTEQLTTTVEYLRDQCNNSVLRDMASEAKSLLRISESVDGVKWRLQYEGTKLEPDDDTVLKECAEDSYLAGVFLLDVDGNIVAQYNSGDLTEKQSNTDTQAGVRPTKQTAQAYLGKAYLIQGKYAEALTQFKAVINSSKATVSVLPRFTYCAITSLTVFCGIRPSGRIFCSTSSSDSMNPFFTSTDLTAM